MEHSCLGFQQQEPLESRAGVFITKSTLVREYTPTGTTQKSRDILTWLRHPITFLRAKFDLRCFLPKWSGCLGNSNFTRDNHQEADHGSFHRWLVFIVSATLSQPKSWRTQRSSTCKSPSKNSNPHTRRDCVLPLNHPVSLSRFLSR